MNDWQDVSLGDVAVINPEATPKNWSGDRKIRYVDIASVSRERGIDVSAIDRIPFESAPGRARRRIRERDVLVSTVRPNLRAFAVVPKALDGEVASTGFAVVRARAGLVEPGFLWALISSDAFVDGMVARCTGSNYPAIRGSDVADYRFQLPPLTEQRRIADVLAAVDEQIAALATESHAAWDTWRAALSVLDESEKTLALGSGLRSIDAGKSPRGVDRVPSESERAVLKISAVQRGRFVPTEVKTVGAEVDLPASTRVGGGDVLLVRCNAMLDRVGTVCRVPEDPGNLYLCDKTLRLVADEQQLAPNYLVHAMASPSVRRQIAERTAGSDMRNIGQAAIRELRIPDPGIDQQRLLGDALDQLIRAALSVEKERDALDSVRSTLLATLLGQTVDLPQSCDGPMETVG